jgi:glycosyltransferase involved in cell wall biosynthesis
MKLLLITNYFPPEIGAASHLYYDLASKLVEQGHEVSVVTGFPRYNVNKDDLPVRYKVKALTMHEVMNGISVYRIKTAPFPKYVPIARGLDYLTVATTLLLRSLLLKKHDVALVYSPPLFLGNSAWALRLVKGTPFVVNVQDLFPQSAIDLGLLTNQYLIKAFRWLERKIYEQADAVTVHSEGNAEHVETVSGKKARPVVMPNWVDTNTLKPAKRHNDFSREYGLDDKFVVSFAGTLGYSQDVGIMVRAAEELQDLNDLLFLIVGDGAQKEEWVAKSAHLKNVRWLPMQPREVYPSVLHASDICLATLKADVKTPVVPSKILSIMSAGKPVIATMDLAGDAPRIIKEAEAGYALAAEDETQLASAIRELYSDRAKALAMGMRGREYVMAHFSLEACATLYVDLFQTLLKPFRKTKLLRKWLILPALILSLLLFSMAKMGGKNAERH